ncbi:hypothetical protein F2Q69_00061220 [Brassica cretica]|uniref:Uncharacterized protein n=1 Tax=Brassica cretica TaxID=69181 RepID=A0A8S9RLG4_BRACR|nr:hypothetical protein F2Q69_00061220 [Brassica cretica]
MDHYRPGSIIKVDRKLDKFGTSLCCNKYVAPDVTGVIRYHVELYLQLGTATIVTYVVFNREITKITKQDAATLNGGGGQELPRCLEKLAGKEYVFQIRAEILFISIV